MHPFFITHVNYSGYYQETISGQNYAAGFSISHDLPLVVA